jgi:hypothetical protein
MTNAVTNATLWRVGPCREVRTTLREFAPRSPEAVFTLCAWAICTADGPTLVRKIRRLRP